MIMEFSVCKLKVFWTFLLLLISYCYVWSVLEITLSSYISRKITLYKPLLNQFAGKAEDPTFKRKLSKREKKELKKAEKAAKAAEKANGDKDKDEGVAEKLYTGKLF